MYSTRFAHLKCWSMLSNFFPKSLNHLYFCQQWVKMPIFRPLRQPWVSDLWKLSIWWGRGVEEEYIALLQFTILLLLEKLIIFLNAVHIPCFLPSLMCSSYFCLMNSKCISVIFFPKRSLSFNFICNAFYYKICKTSKCLSFPLWLLGLICHLERLYPYKIFFHSFFF